MRTQWARRRLHGRAAASRHRALVTSRAAVGRNVIVPSEKQKWGQYATRAVRVPRMDDTFPRWKQGQSNLLFLYLMSRGVPRGSLTVT